MSYGFLILCTSEITSGGSSFPHIDDLHNPHILLPSSYKPHVSLISGYPPGNYTQQDALKYKLAGVEAASGDRMCGLQILGILVWGFGGLGFREFRV